MSKTVIALSIAGSLAFGAATMAQQPATTPDPKMPPMPSMEAPDSTDMTKPAGPLKPAPATKTKLSGKPASPVTLKRSTLTTEAAPKKGSGRAAKGSIVAKQPVAARRQVMMKARPARIGRPTAKSVPKSKRR